MLCIALHMGPLDGLTYTYVVQWCDSHVSRSRYSSNELLSSSHNVKYVPAQSLDTRREGQRRKRNTIKGY